MTSESIEAKLAELHAADERNKLIDRCAAALAKADNNHAFQPFADTSFSARRARDDYSTKARTVLEAASEELWAKAKHLRGEPFRSGQVGIEYVNGMEDAAGLIDPED
jgi:hypothetical protein